MNHLTVHLNLLQHCKLTLLQLKNIHEEQSASCVQFLVFKVSATGFSDLGLVKVGVK